ncbi:immunoglobulin-binding protein 1-like [Clavelina lepadiformis]
MEDLSNGRKLVDVFNDLWALYHEIDNSVELTLSEKYQNSVKKCLQTLNFLSQTVRELSMFSDNEDFEEVATSDLRYFVLPALKATLIQKKQTDINGRGDILKESLEHFVSFLKLCSNYGLGPASQLERIISGRSNSEEKIGGNPDLAAMNAARETKIAKYRKEKEQAALMKDLEGKLQDEEILRKYWLLQINKWIGKTIDEVTSARFELEMLTKMKDIPRAELNEKKSCKKPSAGKPFILTKDRLQASVFGAGYPSLPTVTLDEFYERELAAGRMSARGQDQIKVGEEKDSDDDEDDEKVKKQRDFDDWKDTHRRGAGNRKNMG